MKDTYGDVSVKKLDGHIIECEIRRPPNNFFDIALINDLSDCYDFRPTFYTENQKNDTDNLHISQQILKKHSTMRKIAVFP